MGNQNKKGVVIMRVKLAGIESGLPPKRANS